MALSLPQILFIGCGGTIDKCYPKMTQGYAFEFGEFSATQEMFENELKDMINFEPIYVSVCKKDSMEMDDNDRDNIVQAIKSHSTKQIVITHGTDTMIQTAQYIANKVDIKKEKLCIFITGAMKPAKFKNSDAMFNIGCAISGVQMAKKYQDFGIYITMNGQIYRSDEVTRDQNNGKFVYSKL